MENASSETIPKNLLFEMSSNKESLHEMKYELALLIFIMKKQAACSSST